MKRDYDHTTSEGQKRMFYESAGLPFTDKKIDPSKPGDYGCDPIGDGKFRMIPSGDIVDAAEKNRRLKS